MEVVAKGQGVSTERLLLWITMLALAQLADLVTTQAAMSRGGIEANQVAALLIAAGGIPLLWAVKGTLVLAMAGAVRLVFRYRAETHDRRWAVAGSLVWRGLQLCVVVLALTALHNLTVITQLSG